MIDDNKNNKKPAEHKGKRLDFIREASARLMAVQALYQMSHVETDATDVISEYLEDRLGEETEEGVLADPDAKLLKQIVIGADERRQDLQSVINTLYAKRNVGSDEQPEPLLNAVFLTAGYELLAHTSIDFPIIINDYLNVTDAFYGKKEKTLVNGMLDQMAKIFRDTADDADAVQKNATAPDPAG